MTTLSKDEVIAMARAVADKEKVDPFSGGFISLTPDELAKFATLCRADLVEEVERLKAGMNPDWDVKSACMEAVREMQQECIVQSNEASKARAELAALRGSGEPKNLLMPPTRATDQKIAPVDLSRLPQMHGHNGQSMYREAKELADLLSTQPTDMAGLEQQLHIANTRIRALQGLAAKVEELEDAALLAGSQEPCAVFLGWNEDGSANLDACCEGPETLDGEDIPLYLHPQPSAVPVVEQMLEALSDEQYVSRYSHIEQAIAAAQQWLKEQK